MFIEDLTARLQRVAAQIETASARWFERRASTLVEAEHRQRRRRRPSLP